MTTIAIIGAVAAIIGTGFGIFIGLRSKQVFRPVLTLSVGLLYANPNAIPKPYKKVVKKTTISTLIYGANVPQNSEVVLVCPYLLINSSKLPVSNITLQVEYPSKYAIEKEVVIREGMDYKFAFGYRSEDYKSREVQIFDSMAQIRCTIPVLRAEEKVVIPDIMKFTCVNRCEESNNGDYVIRRELAKKLRKIKKLRDFCVVDVFVYSENCPPLSKRIKLLWFDTNSPKELGLLVGHSVKAFWGGKWPKPGLYFRLWPWEKFMVQEYGEAIIPKLKVVKTSKDRYLCWEKNPLKSERNIFILKMPPWNYYQLSDNVADTDDLIRKSGFMKLR